MKTATRILTWCAVTAVIAWAAAPALADPLPGRDRLKFQQKPLDGLKVTNSAGVTQTYWGHDELSTAGSFFDPATNQLFYQGDFMADDFSDENPNPVVHVKWWGSYLDGVGEPNAAGALGVQKFLISFESDVPFEPATNPWSRPGTPLLNQIVKRGPLAPGSGTFTERKISAGGTPLNETLYEYNAELQLEFPQEPDTVYWLKIVALDDLDPGQTFPNIQWGWHDRDYTVMDPLASPLVKPGERVVGALPDGTRIWHHQDDAVSGFVGVFPNPNNNPDDPRDDWLVNQDVSGPTHYLDGIDGPGPSPDINFPGIGRFSKDLAFELYTVPEPSTLVLAAMGLVGLVGLLRRRKA